MAIGHLRVFRRKASAESSSSQTLERTLRRELGLPILCAHTIHRVRLEAGYTYQQSRTWCPTGTAERVRKEGVVVVHDPQTEGKTALIEQAYQQGEKCETSSDSLRSLRAFRSRCYHGRRQMFTWCSPPNPTERIGS